MKPCLGVLLFVSAAVCVRADEPTVAVITHRQLQAVNQYGVGTYNATDKVVLEGIVLNAPEMILNPAPGTGFMGGQWQIYFQGEGDDHAGTAVWLGQYYHKVTTGNPNDSYTHEELLAELCRINADPVTRYFFAPGDRIRVTGWYKFYGGKTNINEQHQKNPFFDFQIELVKPAVGLPEPEAITLADLKDAQNQFIFDPNRNSGPEYYQGRLVRIENVRIINPANWGPDMTLTVEDGLGRTFPVKLGIGKGFLKYPAPEGWIDIIGILDQEAPGCTLCNYGYRLWVPNYDGNGLVLTDRGHRRGNLPGDLNSDYSVDLYDLAELAGQWLTMVPGLCGCP
ncbi:MAG: hypothetical protein WHS88_05910 [Anaerohalosphaeraceae bacterium]